MADFCSLCGYSDINIEELYDKHIKPSFAEDIKILKDGEYSSVGVGVCEHCGMVRFGINNKYEAWAGYYEAEAHNFGVVNKETLELEIFEDDPKYNEQRIIMKYDVVSFELEMKMVEMYCLKHVKKSSSLTDEERDIIGNKYTALMTNL